MAEEFFSLVNNQISFPRDFLKVFLGTGFADQPPPVSSGGCGAGEEVELRMGLSVGSCFGAAVEKGDIARSSSTSITSVSTLSSEKENVQHLDSIALARASSLPAEIDEDHRKRQSLRRLEAKRKRSEKRNASNGSIFGSSQGSGFSSASDAGTRQGLKMPKLSSFSSSSEKKMLLLPSDNESRSKVPLLLMSPAAAVDLKRRIGADTKKEKKEEDDHSMSMPCVSTTGSGPGGRKIQGFLYRYRKGEDVSIVCVCHGKLLTPAEFVKHAGGGDVAHPLKHIVVNTSPAAF